MAFSLPVTLNTVRRSIATHCRLYAAGKKTTGKRKVAVINEPEPVRDTTLLCTRCCGLNKYIDGEDPVLKPDNEYPDWLWNIHTGKPKRFDDYSVDSREYWLSLARLKLALRNKPRKGISFYRKPKLYQTQFISRLRPKKDNDNVER